MYVLVRIKLVHKENKRSVRTHFWWRENYILCRLSTSLKLKQARCINVFICVSVGFAKQKLTQRRNVPSTTKLRWHAYIHSFK